LAQKIRKLRRGNSVNTGSNDVARFLAGMPVPENSSLAPLTRDPAWLAHAAFFEEQFLKTTPQADSNMSHCIVHILELPEV